MEVLSTQARLKPGSSNFREVTGSTSFREAADTFKLEQVVGTVVIFVRKDLSDSLPH